MRVLRTGMQPPTLGSDIVLFILLGGSGIGLWLTRNPSSKYSLQLFIFGLYI